MSYLLEKTLTCKNMQDVDALAAKVALGRISSVKAANLLMDFVYRNKNAFALSKMQEDHFVDLLLIMRPKFELIFDIYNPQKGAFSGFFYGVVRCSYRTWKRQQVKLLCAENQVLSEAILYREEQEERYQYCEASNVYSEEKEEMQRVPSQETQSLRLNKDAPMQRINTNYWEKHFQDIRKKIILIYALKSYSFLDENVIQRVVQETGIEEKKFRSMCEELETCLYAKERRRNACKRSRDNAYYYRNLFLSQLELTGSDSDLGQKLLSKFQHQDEVWKNANKRLNKKICIVCPTAKNIGQVMGLSARQVLRLMKVAQQNIDILQTNRYHSPYENISSYRQHEQKARNAANLPSAYYRNTQRRRPSI